MGPEKEGGVHLRVQVPGRQRPAVTDGHKRTEKTKCAAVDIPRLNSKLWIEIVMCSRNPLLRLETGVCIGCISNVKPLLLM